MSACRQRQDHCHKWMHRSSVLMYEGHFESNASYFIMLSHIRGGSWWYDSRGWTLLPKACMFGCRVTDGSTADSQNGISHGSAYEAECVTELLNAEENVPNDIHWRLVNVYGLHLGSNCEAIWSEFTRICNCACHVMEEPEDIFGSAVTNSYNHYHTKLVPISVHNFVPQQGVYVCGMSSAQLSDCHIW
jgi:hypothetical protein